MKKILFIIFISVSIFFKTNAKEEKLNFLQHISLPEGLSHNGVTDIIKDKNGYIWIATYDGLNKYNGSNFITYKNTISNHLLSNNRIRSLAQDKNGNILIGTEEGVDVYDYTTGQFHNIYLNNQESGYSTLIIRNISFTQDDKILCLTNKKGILVFDERYKLVAIENPEPQENNSVNFMNFKELDINNWLFSTSEGLLVFNLKENKFHHILEESITNANQILTMNDTTLLIIKNIGICSVSYHKEKNGKYTFKHMSDFLSDESFVSASIDKYANLWLGSFNYGILRISNLHNLIKGKKISKSRFSLKGNILRSSCILTDSKIGCWLGTFNEGIYHFSLKLNPFRYVSSNMDYKYGLKSNSILSINTLSDDIISITTNGGGYNFYDTKKDKYLKTLNSKTISGPIYKDSRGIMWTGNSKQDKLLRKKPTEKKFNNFISKEESQIKFSINKITEDKYGNLWVGCKTGLLRIQLDSKGDLVKINKIRLSKKPNDISHIRYLYMDPSFNIMWIGTDYQGLYRINIGSNGTNKKLKIDNYRHFSDDKFSISSNFVTSIIRVPKGDLWIGTEQGGINKVTNSNTNPIFTTFSERDGLSNNVVKNILVDKENNMWITTNKGLNKFRTKDNWIQRIRREDGLPFEDFEYSAQKLGNGYFVIGSQRGLLIFKPEEVNTSKNLPEFHFGKLRVRNKEIQCGDTLYNRILLHQNFDKTSKIELKYNENVISVTLDALHYSNSDNYYFKYKLTPTNKKWTIIPTSKNIINFAGLQPGKYSLEVKISDSLNNWSNSKKKTIIISPPFWKSIPAFIIYIIIVCLIIFLIIKEREKILKIKFNLQLEKIEKKRIKEVDEEKFTFFANISHEFRTPLTLIAGPIDSMMTKYKNDYELTNNLSLIKRQSNRMLSLIEQVLDFRKSEKNLLKLNYSIFKLSNLIDDITKDFHNLAHLRHIEFISNNTIPDIFVNADKDKIEKILGNILNNSFKYTSHGDSIDLEITKEDNNIKIVIQDSGKGISKEDLPHVFDRFFQTSKSSKFNTGGSGIGLSYSKKLVELHNGKITINSRVDFGTKTTIILPIATKETADTKAIQQEVKASSLTTNINIPEKVQNDVGEYTDSLVFLSEDNTDMRIYLENSLKEHFKVKTFENGLDLTNFLEKEWPDIIISDVLMPEFNGFELCDKIKSDIKTAHIPIILLTACTSDEEKIKGVKKGADRYITKPFDMQFLISSIQKILKSRNILKKRYKIDSPLLLEKKEGAEQDKQFLEKLYKLMEENCENSYLDMDFFAKQLYLNRTYFYKKVKTITGKTPYELFKDYRLKKSVELLIQEQKSVSEASIITGFKSRQYFSRAFKEKYGISPGKYVQEKKKEQNI